MKILVVDDEEMTSFLASFYLEECGFQCFRATSGQDALEMLTEQSFDAVLADYLMPGMDGLELLKQIKQKFGNLPFIMMTAYGTIERAVVMMREGANDFIQKPLDPDILEMTVRRSLAIHQMDAENRKLKQYIRDEYTFQSIVTQSAVMRQALILAERAVAGSLPTIALYGESGSGKEMLARAIHFARGGLPDQFVAVNCAGIPGGLLESELFGHVKGAFTGADRERQGKFELCRSGTLLLDEIGDMPLEIQAKLLRVLEERTFEKVGSNRKIHLNANIIVATHRNLEKMVVDGLFRADLYYRVNVFPITVPPLRERTEDIPLLIKHFFTKFRNHIGKRLPGISAEALKILTAYHWPGNIRELKNCIERAAILAADEPVKPEHLIIREACCVSCRAPATDQVCFEITLSQEECSLEKLIVKALEIALNQCGNNISQAAKLLKVDRKMFYRRR